MAARIYIFLNLFVFVTYVSVIAFSLGVNVQTATVIYSKFADQHVLPGTLRVYRFLK